MKEILVSSNNADKLSEIKEVFKDENLKILSLKECNLNIDVIEDQDTLEGNALKKAKEIFSISKIQTISDDTGLFVEALRGEPGVYSSRYAGDNASYNDNCLELLKNMNGIPEEQRAAYFKCVICFYVRDEKYYMFDGICSGKIINEKRGTKGFGYDSLFIPDGFDKTFAEMDTDKKNEISHRGKALEKLRRFIKVYYSQDET